MNGLVRIEMAKGRLAARRQQKVVHADAIRDNFEHRARAVRPQAVARGQPDRLLIIEGSAVRQRLAGVVGHEGDHVADLPALRVDYLEDFTASKSERGAAARRDFDRHGRSEARRDGKECVSPGRSRWSPYHSKKKNTTKR